ncbi:MAG TPA: ABC transporter ATP-binding protein, partial [candidate division Zixibacteria bacterium]|nr:ABC transporter ATP-binding protein [candidate division Zixibacteria bacterium]
MKLKYTLPKVSFAETLRVYRRFGSHLAGRRGKIALSGVAGLGISLLTIARPWPIKIALDYILMPTSAGRKRDVFDWLLQWDITSIIALTAAAVLIIAALRGLCAYGQEVLAKSVGHQIEAEIRLGLFSHIQRLPQSYHDYRETGELITRLTGDINLLQEMLVSTWVTLGSQVIIITGMLALMFWIDPTLALVGLAVMPLFLLAAFRFSGRIQRSARHQREKFGKMVASVQESFAGIAQVKGFARERQRERLIGKSVGRDYSANLKTTKLTASYARAVEMITAVGTAAVLWIGIHRALEGIITAGDLIIFITYLRGVYRPLQNIARHTTKVAKALSRAEKISEIFDLQPEVQDIPNPISAAEVRWDFAFKDVSFTYESGKRALDGFTCEIPAGKTTLIVGQTGAGKSTIAKLLLRLYSPDQGVITLDNRNIADYRIRSLRKRLTPLTQDAFLFRTSVRENIAFGKPGSSDAEIVGAALLVGAESFIADLPDGYETLVGEGGATLSGGQRQLISFARAALRNTPVMILDEPATGMDIYTEAHTRKAIEALCADRTFVIITHRLNFLELADWVIFVRNGAAVESGAPADLLGRESALRDYV